MRTRALRGVARASLGMETVEEPLRRWGSQTGLGGGWGLWGDGRTVVLSRSTAPREREERWLEGLRALGKRGRQPPGTLPTDGTPGFSKAIDALGPRARRRRCGFPPRQQRHAQGPSHAWPAGTALGAARRAAPTCAAGPRRQQPRLAPWPATLPAACRCLADEAEARLTHLQVPGRHRPYGRTSHLAACAFAEERRRTQVRPPLWDEARWGTLVFAVRSRGRERWGKKPCSAGEQPHSRALRQSRSLDHPLLPRDLGTKDRSPRRSAVSAGSFYRKKRT